MLHPSSFISHANPTPMVVERGPFIRKPLPPTPSYPERGHKRRGAYKEEYHHDSLRRLDITHRGKKSPKRVDSMRRVSVFDRLTVPDQSIRRSQPPQKKRRMVSVLGNTVQIHSCYVCNDFNFVEVDFDPPLLDDEAKNLSLDTLKVHFTRFMFSLFC